MLSTVKNLFGEFMNAMIKKLLQGQAVEWRALGEVCYSIKTGLNPRRFFQLNTDDATNYYVTIRELQNHQIVFTDKTDKMNDEALELCNNRSNLEAGDILFSGTGTVGTVALIKEKPRNWNIKEGVYAIKPMQNKILPKFLLYLFESEKITNDFLSQSAGGTVKSIPMKKLAKIQIPIPPLSVQSHIVQILDTFTELNDQLRDELTAELSMRQKQYQYYRDFLLSEHELAKVGFEWKTLGKLGIINRGKRVVKSQLTTEGVYPVYQNSLQPLGYFDKSNVKANTTFMITAGAAGEIGYSNCAFWSADDCYYFDCPKDVLDDRFLYHSLKKQQNKIFSQVRKASIPRLGRNSVENIKIPIPPLSVQSHIVQILDTFDTLTQSISEGLPKEIKLRQKQYEYYREQLLNFKATI